jgi:hypothetical protein
MLGNIGTRAGAISVPRTNPQDRVCGFLTHPRAGIGRYLHWRNLCPAGASKFAGTSSTQSRSAGAASKWRFLRRMSWASAIGASCLFRIRRAAPAPAAHPARRLEREATPRGRSGAARTSGSWDRRRTPHPAGALLASRLPLPLRSLIWCGLDRLTTSVEEHPGTSHGHDHHVRVRFADRLAAPPAVGQNLAAYVTSTNVRPHVCAFGPARR